MERKSSKELLVEGEKLPSKDFIALFSSQLALFWNTTEQVKFLQGLRCMILSITVKELKFWNGNLIYVIRNVSFTFDFKKIIRKRAQICNRGSLEYFAMHSRRRTHDAESVTRIAFKYKLTVFRINVFKNDFSV